jgi:hypothetical protein
LEDEKMSTKRFMSVVVLFLAITGVASADHYIDSGTHSWVSNANWLDGTAPTATDDVYFVGWAGSPEVCNIGSGDNALAGNTYVGWSTAGPTTTLNITGTGKLTTGAMSIAVTDDSVTDTVNVKDTAALNLTGVLTVGQSGVGTLHMTGGTVTAKEIYVTMWFTGAVGHIQLDGGLLWGKENFWMGVDGMDSSMDINGGTLKVPYSLGSTIENYIAAGKITAKGLNGLSNFVEATDGLTYTTFQAVPEPMTLSLLAIGGLLLRRKK